MSQTPNKVSLTNLVNKTSSNETISSSKAIDGETLLNNLVEMIVKEFTTNHADLINDSENGNIPENCLVEGVDNFIRRKGLKGSLGEGTRAELIKKIKDYFWGYNILQDLIDDPKVSDIKIISYDNIFIKVLGKRLRAKEKFTSKESYDVFANYIVVKLGGALDQRNALQTLSDSSNDKFNLRVEVSLPIVNSVNNAYLSIRKIQKDKPLPNDLIAKGMFNQEINDYMEKAVTAGLNMVVSGKGGSGKTTFINAWLESANKLFRSILVIQDSEELNCLKPNNIMFQKVKVKTGEDDVEYTLRDYMKHAMIWDLDMIVIGEIKDAAAMDLFQAIYTGHIGWATLHANNAEETPEKLILYMGYSNTNLKRVELLKMLASLDIIVFMRDYRVMEITEVAGFDIKSGEIIYNPVFKYDIETGKFQRLNDSCDKVKSKFEYAEYAKEKNVR